MSATRPSERQASKVSFKHDHPIEKDGENLLNAPTVVPGVSYERIDTRAQEVEEALQEAGLVTPPDGRYGWVIVAASFLVNVIVDGVNFTAGQGFVPQWETYYNATSGDTAWSVSLLTGFYLLAGPFVSALANFYGCRIVCGLGVLVACGGFASTIFAPTLPVLLVTFGVLGGIGFGMMYLPAIVIVSYYFQKRRALATGIAACGSGIGMFTFAPLISFLIDRMEWQGTMGVVCAVTATGLLCAALFKPLTPTDEQVEKVQRDKAQIDS